MTSADDLEAIRHTLAQYAQLCDDGRFDEWAQLYTEDCRFHVMGKTYEGRSDTQAFITKGQPPERRGKHLCFNSVIELRAGDGRASDATAITDYIFIDQAKTITSAGRYHDRLVRDGDRWRFAERRIVFLGESAAQS